MFTSRENFLGKRGARDTFFPHEDTVDVVNLVKWLACLIFTAAIGVRIPVVAVKFHNVYDYTIVRHPWQVSENHKPLVHPSHVREIGYSVGCLAKHKIEL